MDKFELPDNIMKELKCNLCCEYLSYAPITLHADTGSVCGRCPSLEAERNIVPLRESNYEKIAKNFLLFPCRYRPQGCEGLFSMDEIPTHEIICSLKPFFCPVMPLGVCPWQGTPSESHMHFATDHHDLLLQANVFELDLINTYSTNLLMVYMDCLFLVHKEYNDDNGMFYCGIYQITNYEIRQFDYVLEFKSGDEQKKFQVGDKNVPTFKNDIFKDDGFKVNVPVIRETLNSPMMITCTIGISERVHVIEDQAAELSQNEIYTDCMDQDLQDIIKVEDDKMLIDLECPVCQEYMIPPIYICARGHSICGTCKPQLRECPSCRGALSDARNFGLEKMTEHIMYQCRNHIDGCAHRSNSKEIRKHELECKFSPTKCPMHELLECKWKGLSKAIISHMKIDHGNLLIFEPLLIKAHYIDEETYDEQRVTKMFGELFRLRVSYNNDKKKFWSTVQMIGTTEDARKFRYEVQLVDKTKDTQLISRKHCGGISDKKTDGAHCTVFPIDMVLPYMSDDNNIHVRFKIIKT